MRKYSLLFLVLILTKIASAQLVAPVMEDVPSSIQKTSFYIYITDSNMSEDSIEVEIKGGGVTRLINLPGGSIFNQPITGLMPKTTYQVRARAKGACSPSPSSALVSSALCAGPWSNIKYITTLVDIPPMATPRLTNNCPKFVGIAWDINTRPEDVSEIIVQRSFNTSSWETIANLTPGVRQHFDNDARNGRTMFYRVVTLNSLGEQTVSPMVTVFVKPFTGPKDPQMVRSDQTEKSDKHLTIKWNNPEEDTECGSDIRSSIFLMIKKPGDSNYTIYKEFPPYTNSAVIDGLSPKEVVDYKVWALSNQGLQSNWIGGIDSTYGPPKAPKNLIFVAFTDALNNSNFGISWESNSFDSEFYVLEYSYDSTNFMQLAKVNKSTTNINHFPVQEGVKYYYRVKAGNSYGESPYSPVTFPAVYVYTAIPNAPVGLNAKNDNGKVMLKWQDESVKEENYILERSVDNNSNFTLLATLPRNTTTYIDETVAAGKKYFYKVKAVNPLGSSNYSNEAEITASAPVIGGANSPLVMVFPNPTLDLITIDTKESNISGLVNITITDQNNNVLIQKQSNKSVFDISMLKLKTGIYNVIIESDQFKETKKIVKF